MHSRGEYILISIDLQHTAASGKVRSVLDVTVKKKHTEENITLKKISLPAFVEIGDVIRWCEHRFYDVIDANGDFVYR